MLKLNFEVGNINTEIMSEKNTESNGIYIPSCINIGGKHMNGGDPNPSKTVSYINNSSLPKTQNAT